MKTRRYDVVVAGGGPAGVAAAIAAARSGASTLLLERYGALGGTPVHALVPVFCPFSDGRGPVVAGIGLEVLRAMERRQWYSPLVEKNNGIPGLDWVPIDPEALKLALDELVLDSGVALSLHTAVVDVEREGGSLRALRTFGKGGAGRVEAGVFIDATGDADLIAQAGAPFEYGDSEGRVQGMTLCFRLGGVDGRRFLDYKKACGEDGNLHQAVARAKAAGDFPAGEAHVATFTLQNWDMAGVNFGHVFERSPINAQQLTQAEVEARRRLPELVRFFQTYVPGLEHCWLAQSGAAIGVRESRRIVGDYRLTRRDYQERREFDDAVARYSYPIDVHAGSCDAVQPDPERDEYVTTAYAPGESYTIPYRALLPQGLDNVLAAGRCVSSDRAMNGSVRVAPACFAMGQAAGTAAALAVRTEQAPRQVDRQELRRSLLEQGCYL